MRHRRSALLVLTVVAVLLAGCTSSGSDTAAPPSTTTAFTPTRLRGYVAVSADASLTDAFTQLGQDFEAAHPGTRISFDFGESRTLSKQIASGAAADLFASADQADAQKLVDAHLAEGAPRVFARKAVGSASVPNDAMGSGTYPIVVLKGSQNPALATAFARYLASAAGRATLEAKGFTPSS